MNTSTLKTTPDRELLEAAAKVAGVPGVFTEVHGTDTGQDAYGIGPAGQKWWPHKLWNPLTDDGDALRLAVKLKLCIEFGYCSDDAPVVRCGLEWARENWSEDGNFPDPDATTRRAIVRAAAALAPQGVPG